jgi:hypothetical protein
MKTADEQIEKMARDISQLEISDTLIESLHSKEIDEILIFVTSARLLSELDFNSKRYAVLELILITDEVSE